MEKKEIEKRINELQSMLDLFKKDFIEKSTFEVGKWYKHHNAICCYTRDKEGYGISCTGRWENDIHMSIFTEWTPASDEEVFEALKKEAERRGFKENKFTYITDDGEKWKNTKFNRFEYYDGCLKLFSNKTCDGSFYDGYNVIFEDGKWLEIIKDEPIKVGGYEVTKDKFIIGETKINIGCKKIGSLQVENIKFFMQEYGFKKVAFDGVEVSLETIEKILKM